MLRPFILWLTVFSFVIGAPAHASGKELVVGVLPYQSARPLIAEYQNLATHLRSALDRPVRIVTAKDTKTFAQRMLAGDYELAVAPGHLVRLAQLERGWHPLARYAPDTSVLLLARKQDADITPANLKGKVLATPDRLRLVSLAAENWLANQHLEADHDYTVLETAGFGSAVHALLIGQADMAVVTRTGMEQVRNTDAAQVQVMAEITSIPLLMFIARANVKPNELSKLRNALLGYQTPNGMNTAPVSTQDLTPMDAYLDETRRRLKNDTQLTRRAIKP